MGKYNEFRKGLEKLINQHSMENGSNTPDFILAEYLTQCLEIYELTHNKCVKWHIEK